ncbi:MAG: gfo/Idh/MocA family oxidoreductase, partial [Bacteroidota bacterium]
MASRRDFLHTIGFSAIALPFVKKNISAGIAENMNSKYDGPVLKVAIMGLGSYGTRVAEAMRDCKMAKLTGVISGTPSKIKDWQAKYGIPEKNCYNYEN